MFSADGLKRLFDVYKAILKPNKQAFVWQRRSVYISTIDKVVSFLQGKQPSLAHSIVSGNLLPQGTRFGQLADLEWSFGELGIQDKAKHLATLYLEDLSDFVQEVDPDFGFSRYAESISVSASSFSKLYKKLHDKISITNAIAWELLEAKINEVKPDLIGFSAPFPGNIFSSFKMAQLVKERFPSVKLVLGGGYPNTELRSLKEERVFEFFDFITLDDGEAPILNLISFLKGEREKNDLKRCFSLDSNGKVKYYNGSKTSDFKQKDVGTPCYEGLPTNDYLQILEMANSMHRLWNDGRWNKLTLAHGCYWAKCTFCDVSLDYIRLYEAATAKILVDRMEELILQTGEIGFHFVDEAAPPSMMKELALEILKRNLNVVWWTNIRFEKSFTLDLCQLLAKSGCIAISGGLEVASDRLLQLIDKGVSVAQVSRAARNLTESGILVHAYLMYGYPTQTEQETIDSLEIVRQLYELGIVKSGYWHRFALTVHSPIGMHPEKFGIEILPNQQGSFANNEIAYYEPDGIDHGAFSEGLRKSLYNYMHGICFEYELQEWFEFEIPETTVRDDYIENAISVKEPFEFRPNKKLVWLGTAVQITRQEATKKNKVLLKVFTNNDHVDLEMKEPIAIWLSTTLINAMPSSHQTKSLKQLKESYEMAQLGNFEKWLNGKVFKTLNELGLIVV